VTVIGLAYFFAILLDDVSAAVLDDGEGRDDF